MTAILKLIAETHTLSQEESNGKVALSYYADYRDFSDVNLLLTLEDYNKAADMIDDMDTEPREAIICAIAKDYGADFVEKKLGWLV